MNIKISFLVVTFCLLFLCELYSQSQPGICGDDDRYLTVNKKVGRIWKDDDSEAVGTAFLIANGKLVTAGHVAGKMVITYPNSDYYVEFNDFESEDRYKVNKSSITYNNGGVDSGHDWAVIQVFENDITELMPIVAQGEHFKIMQTTNLQDQEIKITGYSENEDPNMNRLLQSSVDLFYGYDGYVLRYTADSEDGNSGSPIIDKNNPNIAIGVHTFAQCNSFGYNGGTSFYNPDFWAATGLGIDYTVDQVDENQEVGRYEVNFNAYNLASGVYLYRLKVNDFVDTKKMILLK
ncbi:MAG: hypothetical protein DRQ13_07630 [Ignavibacteriae bacterium]|nr:MAG: hypothetical protein DRQ13_07630 [Ignavibacteriota bacterium]